MFDTLTQKMQGALRSIRGINRISEENIAEALKEVRSALMSADVHFKVVRDFIDKVRKESLGQEVNSAVSPGQLMVKIINDELTQLLGSEEINFPNDRPLKIMMVGLHGSGKTTSTVKLARHLKKQGFRPLVVACDIYRPAAIDQLKALAKQEQIDCYSEPETKKVAKIAKNSLKHAKEHDCNAIIWDTAGRLQINEDLIGELKDLKKTVSPNECFLVGDSALGQEAVNVAKNFNEATELTGIILTKLDGDARGGAALSMKAITQVPIRFSGTGEKLEDFETFHPDRMAQRILGMGDVVSLVEKAQEHLDMDEAAAMEQKMRKANLDFEDFLAQLRQIKKLGSLGSIAKMLPGAGKLQIGQKEEDKFKHSEAIILSMTLKERRNPKLINGSRRVRIAKGAGLEVREVNQLLKEFQTMKKMMKSMKGAKGRKMMKKMAGMQGLPF